MKGWNGKPIIRWSFSPSLQISDWSWGSQIDRTFGIAVAWAARTRRQQLGRGKETWSTVAVGFCSCTFAARDWSPLPVTAGLALLLQSPVLPQLPQSPVQHREAPAAVQNQAPSQVHLPPHCRRLALPTRAVLQTDLLLPARVAAPQLFPSLCTTTILVNQRCSLLPWFDSKFSHFLLDTVRATHSAHTSGKLHSHWLADEEGNVSLHSSKGNKLPQTLATQGFSLFPRLLGKWASFPTPLCPSFLKLNLILTNELPRLVLAGIELIFLTVGRVG